MTPDARLSDAERAALAHLEAAAVADDPRWAARLRGAPLARLRMLGTRVVLVMPAYVIGRLSALSRAGWWGVPLLLAGFVVMIAGLSSGLAVSLAGSVLATAGLWMLAALVDRRLRRRPAP